MQNTVEAQKFSAFWLRSSVKILITMLFTMVKSQRNLNVYQ